MTRLRSTRAASSDGKVTVQGSARLMDDYVYATDLTGETDLTAVQQKDGSYSLLYLGASGNAMSLRQDSKSDTGWSEENLDDSVQPNQVVGAVEASGQFIAFAIGGNAAAPDIYTATRKPDGKWSTWQPLAVDQLAVPPFRRVMNLAAFAIAGKVELFAMLAPSPGYTGDTSLWRIADWSGQKPKWQYIADTDRNIIESCTIAGTPGILFGTIAESNPTKVDLFTVAAPFTGAPARLAAAVSFTSIALGTQKDKNSAVFIADNGVMSAAPQIQYLDGGKPSAGFVQIDNTITAMALAVGSAGETPLALFALDQNGELHFIASPESSASEKNYDFFLRFTGILTATGEDGDAELIGYRPGKGLMRLWRSPPDPANQGDDPSGDYGGWTQEAIQYEPANKKKPTQQSTYATTLTFYDEKGVVISDRELHLRSTEIVSANIAGEVRVLGPTHPLACRTDGAGRIRVTTPTDTLNVAGLSARLPGLMLAGEDFPISPNYAVQERMRVITEDEVRKLVPPKYASSAPHIKQAVHDSMTYIPVVKLVSLRVGAGADLRTPLPVREQPGPAFRFTVANGQAVHTRLTPEAADAAIAEMLAGAPAGIWDTFENMIEALRNAFKTVVEWTYDYVVTPLAKGFKLALTFIADTVKFVWEGIVDTVEAAFRLAETVFEAVKTAFVRLYEFYGWLMSGEVCKEIWATKKQFEKIFNQGMTSLAGYAAQGSQVSHSFFLETEELIRQKFADIETELGSTDANQAIDAKPKGGTNTFLEIIEEASAIAAWLIDKLTPSFGGWSGVNFNVPAGILGQAQTVLQQIEAAFVNEIATLIDSFITRMQRLVTSTQDFGNALLATILGEAKDLILAVLRFLDSVVQNVLTFFANNLETLNTIVFGAKIDISLAQALYDLINPGPAEPLTVLGLGSLVCAFVGTTLYRLLFGKPPFPPEQEVEGSESTGGWVALSGLLQMSVWCIWDLSLDARVKTLSAQEEDPTLQELLATTIIIQLFVQLPAIPRGEPLKFGTPAEISRSAAWLVGFAGPAYKFLWLLGVNKGWLETGPRASIPGSVLLGAIGAAGLGMNCWMLYENRATARAALYVSALCGPISAISKPVRHLIPKPYDFPFVVIADLVSDLGAGIAKIVQGAQMNGVSVELAAPAALSQPHGEARA